MAQTILLKQEMPLMKPSLSNQVPNQKKFFSYGWFLFFLNVIFTGFASTLEVVPVSFLNQFISHFSIRLPVAIYTMSSYYYAFIILQIPIAILLDKYKPKWLVTGSLLITGIGCFLFAKSHQLLVAGIARFLMGTGSAFTFIYGLKSASDWFPLKNFAFRIGLFIALENLCNFILNHSFYHISVHIGWRKVSLVFSIISIALAMISFFFIHNRSGPYCIVSDTKGEFRHGIRKLFDCSQMWVIGITTGLVIGALFSFIGRWGTSFLRTAYQATPFTILLFTITMYLGYTLGSAFFGYVSTSLQKRKMFIPWGILFAILMLILIIYPPYLSDAQIFCIFFALGLSISPVNLGYVTLCEQNIPQVKATAIAVIHTAYAIVIASSDLFTSILLELVTAIGGRSQYNLYDFQISFFSLPIYLTVALFFSFFIRETYARQREI
ncbi:MAG: MFS transporter [Chlamydiota bacterium]